MRWREETRMAAEHDGWRVVDTDGVDNWQGWGVHLLERCGEWAVLSWSYGSCSGCDQYEDLLSEIESTPEQCFEVFRDLIDSSNDEESARMLFSDRKGW